MSPQLDPGQAAQYVGYKIIRLGNDFYYVERIDSITSRFHSDEAKACGARKVPASQMYFVSDAGTLTQEGEDLIIEGGTRSCVIEGNLLEARKESNRLLKNFRVEG